MLVKATNKYEKLNIKDKELNRVPKEGEEFEISEERYKVLTETNKYKEIFVKKVLPKEVEKLNTVTKTATKKTTRKKK